MGHPLHLDVIPERRPRAPGTVLFERHVYVGFRAPLYQVADGRQTANQKNWTLELLQSARNREFAEVHLLTAIAAYASGKPILILVVAT